jgi:RHS repeat-associated protein
VGDGGSTAQYVYDVFNRRIHVQVGSTTTEFIYDYAGRRVSSWNSANTGNEGRVYWDGQLAAYRSYEGLTYFDHEDPLGTERIRTNYAGSTASTYLSLPWGDGYSATVNNAGGDQDNLHYAGLEHDAESDTEHAQFRNYASAQGRWLAPDPYMGSYDLSNPQSTNRYAYALNSPLSFTDPSGLDTTCTSDPTTGSFACTISIPSLPDPGTDNGGGDCSGCWDFGGSNVPQPNRPVSEEPGGRGAGAPNKNCSAGPFGSFASKYVGNNALISGSYTSSAPGIAIGTAVGSIFGPVGAFAGGILGSQLGIGGSISYVPSTGSLYAGPVATLGAGLNGGNGISVSSTNVPSGQSPNAIGNGQSYSVSFLPWGGSFGSTVSKSPGSGPPVVGFAAGTRSPVSVSAGYSKCITHCGC